VDARAIYSGAALYDLIRFNEGIDQALSESVAHYTATRERSREIFLGVLGHDLRTPISVVLMSTRFMMERGKLESPDATAASRVLRSGTRLQNLVRELLDVAHIRLGGFLPIEPKPVDLANSCHEVIDEMRALHPQLALILNMSGDLSTSAQASRIQELLSNLVQNAIQHGSEGTPIIVSARGEQERILITVHNEGPAIPESARQRIFEPLATAGNSQESKISGSLGLGLYIAREIATAHGGSIDVESSNVEGTSFIVILPRH
jgi:signal transduction histidine kinase